MTQFSVPQFVEVEDKIIGPLTLKQFFIFLGGAVTVYLLYRFIPNFFIFILIALPVAGLSLFMSFGKFNGMAPGTIIMSLVGFLSEPRSFIFHKQAATVIPIRRPVQKKTPAEAQALSQQDRLNRLHNLTYILDQDVKEEKELIKDRYIHLR
jgi:thiol:disulfide interchange protein